MLGDDPSSTPGFPHFHSLQHPRPSHCIERHRVTAPCHLDPAHLVITGSNSSSVETIKTVLPTFLELENLSPVPL